MNRNWSKQIQAIIRIEMKKTFFAKRGLWIYILALAPVALFLVHSLVEIQIHGARQAMAIKNDRHLTDEDFSAIAQAMTREQVVARLGQPAEFHTSVRRMPGAPGSPPKLVSVETLRYSDGSNELRVALENGTVVAIDRASAITLGQDSYVFAGVFQFFFIRLAIFFGCLGIFMNLFRGEMVDRSLHFYLLAPVRREVLVIGKYFAGLTAATVIFSLSTALQLFSVLLQFDSATVSAFLSQNHGMSQIVAYMGVTILACLGYGSIFLAAGLLFRNPIVPAAIVLIWEAVNPVLPGLLKKISIIYYLKSLCPVDIPLDPGMPPLLALLVSNAQPISAYTCVIGLLAVSAFALVVAMRRVRRLEINYTTD